MSYVLALDQGTTSSRALVFDREGTVRGSAQQEFRQIFPQPGLGRARRRPRSGRRSRACCTRRWPRPGVGAARHRGDRHHQPARDHACCGTAGPAGRSPTPSSGRTAGPRRSATSCAPPATRAMIARRTGLVLDAYFSGTKLRWLLDHVPGARGARGRGELAFGTIDSWLVWNLTGGREHVTDPSNASRTLLFDIHRGDWDDELLALFDVPRAVLPRDRAVVGRGGDGAARRRRRPDRRDRRRPAGGAVRPGLPRAGARQEHLRHRLLPAAQHRRRARSRRRTTC